MSMRAIAFAGTLYFGLLDENKSLVSGFRRVGNVYPFGLQVSTIQTTQPSALKESAGQKLHTKSKIDDVAGSMSFREYDADVISWALAGTRTAMTGTGGTESGKTVVLIADEWVRIGHRNVSSVVVTGGTLGVDYELNESLGLVRMLSSGGLTAGNNTVAYSYAAESGFQIQIGTQAQIRVAVLLDGQDLETGASVDCEFYSMVLSSNSLVELITDPDSDFGEMPFDLIFETPTGQSSPGVVNGIPLNLY